MPYNDETLARAIFRAEIPIVSAVGHEIDFTIADFVSDLARPRPVRAQNCWFRTKQSLSAGVDQLARRVVRAQLGCLRFLNERSNWQDNGVKAGCQQGPQNSFFFGAKAPGSNGGSGGLVSLPWPVKINPFLEAGLKKQGALLKGNLGWAGGRKLGPGPGRGNLGKSLGGFPLGGSWADKTTFFLGPEKKGPLGGGGAPKKPPPGGGRGVGNTKRGGNRRGARNHGGGPALSPTSECD